MKGAIAALIAFGMVASAARVDMCNRVYWRQKMVGTILVDEHHMSAARRSERKLSNFESIPDPKRILGPHDEVVEKIVDPWRTTVMVDAHNVVIDVDCF